MRAEMESGGQIWRYASARPLGCTGPAGWCCSRGSGRSAVRTQRISDMSSVPRISIFGAPGSVGQSTLDLIDHDPETYDVVALTANRNADALSQAARRHCASIAVVADESAYAALKDALAGTGIEAAAGAPALARKSPHTDFQSLCR